ncbi:MAG TPA: glycosyltransferase family 87 protein [Candidatus Cybelea sp.]|nr:glycosyltransferase family 87 protein [Candidatus Cybelea sp.]
MRLSKTLWLAVAICAIVFSLVAFWRFSSGSLLSDFRAFYCAGQLSLHAIDPYRQEPLYSCEARQVAPILWHAVGHVTDPAPLPPYALALFVPLSLLPFAVAAVTWTLVLVAAWVAVIVALRILTGYPWSALVAAVLFAATMSLSLGQLAPVAIALTTVAALLLYYERPVWAGAVTALALVEPHVALPSCIAVFLAVRRSRLPLVFVALALAAVSMLFGAQRNIEYVLYVLPAHALSDVPDVGQYSLTVLAHVLGLSDGGAAHAGTLWYLIIGALGIATACRVAKRLAFQPLVVALPVAFAVFGGPYVHWQQVAGAIPAALLLASRERRASPLLTAAIVGLAVPWLYAVGWGFLIPGAVAVLGIIVWELCKRRPVVMAVTIAAAFAILLLLNHALSNTSPSPPFAIAVSPNAWADESWGAYVRARIPIGSGLLFWLHVPTWCALAGVVASGMRAAWGTLRPVRFAVMPGERVVGSLGQGS